MRVAAIRSSNGPDALQFEDRDEPAVSPGTVKVRWRALSLNFHDHLVISGVLPCEEGRVPVSDAAGEVVAVGDGVRSWAVGDRVMSTFFPDWVDGPVGADTTQRLGGDTVDGCAAELSVVPEHWLTRMPAGYDFAEAATLPCAALTAWRALVDVANVQPGQTVVVQGSGGVSMFALLFAKALSATVLATSSSDERCARLKALGADQVLNHRQNPRWCDWVIQHTDGGADVVIDVGGPATLNQSLDATRVGGAIVLIGLLGGLDVTLSLPKLLLRQQRLCPITVGSHQHQARMIDLIESSGLRPVIDSRFPFAQMQQALDHLVSGQHFGKIVVTL